MRPLNGNNDPVIPLIVTSGIQLNLVFIVKIYCSLHVTHLVRQRSACEANQDFRPARELLLQLPGLAEEKRLACMVDNKVSAYER